MLKEFKEFAMKGSVVDMAVGVIIAGAFGLIVKSLVDDILMPVVGAIFGGLDFNNMFIGLTDKVTETTLAAAQKQGAVLAYGSFLTTVVNFIIVAFILFMVIKAMNNAKKKEEEAPAEPPAPPAQEVLLSEIRDLLKK
ncbi:Large-conductance mechanosensitive channel [hydrothermal vent metagenome]|uniref:Large-conductance mechanosensitive channel n=1 Tax=hydrothermal vent metagenome TaxID=652676 RepID=A0A3B0S869_9ZZZZ